MARTDRKPASTPPPTPATEPTRITATQLARSLSDILNRVRYRGERFEIQRHGETLAILAPADARAARTVRDFVADIMSRPTPDPTFADDLERVQAEQPPAEFHEWPS